MEKKIVTELKSLAGMMLASFGSPLEIGMVTQHPADGRTVEIIDGQFLDPTYGRLSNFWWWREVFPDGSISLTEESGYGWSANRGTR
jgi:hypothetical protein